MAIKIYNTADLGGAVKVLVYSDAGIGKTTLCGTAPKPIIISTERGLISLKDAGLEYVLVSTLADLEEAYNFTKSAAKYQTICLDSISDLAETILVSLKKEFTDGRQAYGKLNDSMHEWITKFRDIPDKNIYFTAKQTRLIDDHTGITTYTPMMPGKTNIINLPFYFDEVMCMRIGTMESGETYRYLQTQPDISYVAKDRSGKLHKVERPDLTKIFQKIRAKKVQIPKQPKPE